MRRVIGYGFLYLFVLSSQSFAQDASLSASVSEESAGSGDFYQTIGCGLVVDGAGNDIGVSVSLRWSSANVSGENSWNDGSTGYFGRAFTTEVPVSADDMTVQCEALVTISGSVNTVLQRQSSNTAPGKPPYIIGPGVPQYDPGTQWANNRWERHIWHQIYHANSTRWNRGGTVFETWVQSHNPCNLQMVTGVGEVNTDGQFNDSYWYQPTGDPSCTYEGEQSYALSTAAYLTIHRQRWRFDTSGIWRQ